MGGDASGMGGWTSGDACEMGASKEGVVTTRGFVAREPRPVAALVLGLAVAGRPRPLSTLMLGLAVPGQPRPLPALVLGLAIAAESVSCPLIVWPSAARPPPSPTTLFRTRRTWL